MLLQAERTRMSGNRQMKRQTADLISTFWESSMADFFSCAGSNVLVAGTAIFGAKDPKQTIQEMRTAVDDVIAQRK